jgi:hypothetical protein
MAPKDGDEGSCGSVSAIAAARLPGETMGVAGDAGIDPDITCLRRMLSAASFQERGSDFFRTRITRSHGVVDSGHSGQVCVSSG